MSANDTLHRALSKLLAEVFDGPPPGEGFILNPGDAGMLGQLDSVTASEASARPMPGKTTIAAHVDHVRYGLELLNRWAAGEENPWAPADWDASWRRTKVTDQQWQLLRENLRGEAKAWQGAVEQRTEWDDMAAAGSLASLAHTAYHLGAVRQILAALSSTSQAPP